MAYAPIAHALHDLTSADASVRTGPSLFSRFLAALMVSRQRQAEREIARYLRNAGGKFTDESEREIERHFLSSTSSRW
jgi:hypothetical protein